MAAAKPWQCRSPRRSSGLVGQFEEASRLIRAQTDSGDVVAAVLHVRRAGQEMSRAFGAARIDLPFLIASPTKPMTASSVLWLRDRRELALSDPVSKYLPAFRDGERGDVTIRHLLTHTSGLPDMLPDNTELRAQHAPLSEFVARTCRTPLLFRPGTKVSYQSMGILLAAAIVEKVSGEPMPGFMARTIFHPLRMRQTSLGLGGRAIADTAQCQVPQPNAVIGTGTARTGGTSAPHGAARMPRRTIWRHSWKPSLPRWRGVVGSHMPRDARDSDWHAAATLRLRLAARAGRFGRTCSPETFGHFGSTGTMAWHDPLTATTFVLLTTRPATDSKASLLLPASEIIGRPDG